MRILFLGDVVGISGCSKILNNLKAEIKKKDINFVIVNGENSAEPVKFVMIFLIAGLMLLQLEIMFGIKKKS